MSSAGGSTPAGRRRGWHAEGNQWARKHEADFAFFQQIDTEAKAYWLGFILGDGSVYRQGDHLKFKLSAAEEDADHLQQFATDIRWTGTPNIYECRGRPYYEVWVFQQPFCLSLV